MRSAWFRRLGLAAVAGWLAVAGGVITSAGCASPREEINRVQPDAIRKSDLVGAGGVDAPEWYMRNTIVGVPRTNTQMSEGYQDLTRRVRFEIQEQFLIARQAYEVADGADGHGGIRGKTNNGAVVGAWPIKSHFNIQRQYNPSTGEETGIIEENTTDVRWHDREYVRVDWSRNLSIDPSFWMFWYGQAFGDAAIQPVQFFENDPKKPEASNLAEVNTGYFDITNRWLMKADSIDYYGYKLPYCVLQNMMLNQGTYTEGTMECNDQEVSIRASFWKVPSGAESTDYEAFETNGQQQQIVGTLDLQRFSYDQQNGIVDQNFHQLVQRYNMWEKSHFDTACGVDNSRSEGEKTCTDTHGINSTCDMNAKKCTIPHEARKIRKLAFWADQAIPEYLVPATEKSIAIWNEAMSDALATSREAECRREATATGTAPAQARLDCHTKYYEPPAGTSTPGAYFNPAFPDVPKKDYASTIVLCHNPVKKGDDAVCGAEGKKVRKGDIRYHHIGYWANPSYGAPLGVIVPGGDPTSGEHIGTIANVFGGSLEKAAASYRDMISLVNGDLTPEEFVAGKAEELYGTARPNFSNAPVVDPALAAYATKVGQGPTFHKSMSLQEQQARLKAIDVSALAERMGVKKALEGATTSIEKVARLKAYYQKQGNAGVPGFGGTAEANKKLGSAFQAAKAAGLEKNLVDDKLASTMGFKPEFANDPAVVDAISPIGGMSPLGSYNAKKLLQAHREKNHICEVPGGVANFSFGHFDGSAAYFKARWKDGSTIPESDARVAAFAGYKVGDTIDRQVRGRLIYALTIEQEYIYTLIHEIGHLMSEDHDFGASWDSANYFPQYWQLRTKNGSAKAACDIANPRSKDSPDTCMGPRFADPITADELGTEPGKEHYSLESYAISSIMDYHPDSRVVGAVGLGAYDKMATKFIYGRVVEIMDDTEKSLIPNARATSRRFLPVLNSMLLDGWLVGTDFKHYTSVARDLNLFDPKRCRPATPKEIEDGIGVYGQTCMPVQKDHAKVSDLVGQLPAGGFPSDWYVYYARETDANGGRARWPYKYGPSAFANYAHIAVFDSGADFYEVTQDLINWYEYYYLTMFWRRGNREYNPFGVEDNLYNRVYDRFHLLAWSSINDTVRTTGGGTFDPSAFTSEDERGQALAMTMLFDTMQRALLRPQPGGYVAQNLPDYKNPIYGVPEKDGAKGDFIVGGVDARYIDNAYDTNQGYEYQAFLKRVGSYAEKPMAAIGLTDSRPPLSTVARETFLDGRNVMFSFRSSLPQAFDRLVGGAFAQDFDTVSPYVVPEEGQPGGVLPLHTMNLWEIDASKIVRPPSAKLVDPMVGLRTITPALILTLIYQPIDTNMELVQRMRVWMEGSPEAVKVPEDVKVRFYDPNDGVVWASQTFGTEMLAGQEVEKGIGARMLDHANSLLAKAYNVKTKTDPTTGRVTVVYGLDGRPELDVPVGNPANVPLQVKDAVIAAKLKQYTAVLNITRQAILALGFGPCGRGEGC